MMCGCGKEDMVYIVKDAHFKLVNNNEGNKVRYFKNCRNSRVLLPQCYVARESFMITCILLIGWLNLMLIWTTLCAVLQ